MREKIIELYLPTVVNINYVSVRISLFWRRYYW